MVFKNALTHLSCCGERQSCRLLTMTRRRREGDAPSLLHGVCDRCDNTACDTRRCAGQTIRVSLFAPDDATFFVLFGQSFENMLHKPFLLIGQGSTSFTWTFKPLKTRIIHFRPN